VWLQTLQGTHTQLSDIGIYLDTTMFVPRHTSIKSVALSAVFWFFNTEVTRRGIKKKIPLYFVSLRKWWHFFFVVLWRYILSLVWATCAIDVYKLILNQEIELLYWKNLPSNIS
jgi:hypothetical protein